MKRRLISFLLAGCSALCLAGCAGADEPSEVRLTNASSRPSAVVIADGDPELAPDLGMVATATPPPFVKAPLDESQAEYTEEFTFGTPTQVPLVASGEVEAAPVPPQASAAASETLSRPSSEAQPSQPAQGTVSPEEPLRWLEALSEAQEYLNETDATADMVMAFLSDRGYTASEIQFALENLGRTPAGTEEPAPYRTPDIMYSAD